MQENSSSKQLNTGLISIIVPVYNTAEYLPSCLDSIINQSYTNLEIILVNDGSTDASGKICDEYASKDSRIHVITQKNKGQSAARNNGLKHMHGQYVGFVDSDDVISKEMFEVLLAAIMCSGKQIAACAVMKFGINNDSKADLGSSLVLQYSKDESLDIIFSDSRCKNYLCNKVFVASLLCDIELPEGHIFEDYYVMQDIFGKSNGLAYIDLPFYYYRENLNSTSLSMTYEKCCDYIFAIEHRASSKFAKGRVHLLSGTSLDAAMKYKLSVLQADMTNEVKCNCYKYINSFMDEYCRIKSGSLKDKTKFFVVRYFMPEIIRMVKRIYSK